MVFIKGNKQSNNEKPAINSISSTLFSDLNKKPYVCPVCFGRGFVAGGFYSSTGSTWVSSTTAPETCRSCNGTGVLWND